MIQEIVIEAIAKEQKLSPDDISLDTHLDALGVDSLSVLTILFDLEDRLGIDIPDHSVTSLVTIRDVVDQLEQLKK